MRYCTCDPHYIGHEPIAIAAVLIFLFVGYPWLASVGVKRNIRLIPVLGHKWVDCVIRVASVALSLSIPICLIHRFYLTSIFSILFFSNSTSFLWTHGWTLPEHYKALFLWQILEDFLIAVFVFAFDLYIWLSKISF